MRGFFALLTVLPLGACVAEGAGTPPESDTCGASAMQWLVGQPESALAPLTLTPPYRILHTGDPMTMDYSDARLNILIDTKGKVEKIYCG